jgi:hypothetical protein
MFTEQSVAHPTLDIKLLEANMLKNDRLQNQSDFTINSHS